METDFFRNTFLYPEHVDVNRYFYLKLMDNLKHNLFMLDLKSCSGENFKICCLEINSHFESDTVIIFNNGMRSNIQFHFDNLLELSNNLQVPILTYDYPGYGISEGYFTEYNFSESLYNLLRYESENKNRKIVLSGHSLGSGVIITTLTTHHKEEFNIDFILLISTFQSIPKLLSPACFIQAAGDFFGFEHFKNFKRINYLRKYRIKFIHGTNDWFISYEQSKRLCRLFRGQKRLKLLFADHRYILDKIDVQDFIEF